MYKVIHEFADLQNGNKVYKVGDDFSSEGVSEERLAELSGTANKIGVPLIEKAAEPKKPAVEEVKKPSKAKTSAKAEKSPKKQKKKE